MLEKIEKNYGVILGQRSTDYIAGTLPYEILNPSGDWTQWLPPGEWQRIGNLDLMACVTFSGLNVLETIYYFITGVRRNFSDRYNAYLSGTTQQGNWLWKVGDSFRKDGLVDETEWPTPSLNPTWSEYYTPPTIEVINKGKKFLEDWTINYEFIDFTRDSLIKHLKQSPIQVVIPGHAVMNFLTTEQVYKYFDSYEPFVKERTEGFVSALKYTMTRKTKMLDKEDVRFLQALEGFSDESGVEFWGNGTHTLKEYKNARVPDKINELNKLQ